MASMAPSGPNLAAAPAAAAAPHPDACPDTDARVTKPGVAVVTATAASRGAQPAAASGTPAQSPVCGLIRSAFCPSPAAPDPTPMELDPQDCMGHTCHMAPLHHMGLMGHMCAHGSHDVSGVSTPQLHTPEAHTPEPLVPQPSTASAPASPLTTPPPEATALQQRDLQLTAAKPGQSGDAAAPASVVAWVSAAATPAEPATLTVLGGHVGDQLQPEELHGASPDGEAGQKLPPSGGCCGCSDVDLMFECDLHDWQGMVDAWEPLPELQLPAGFFGLDGLDTPPLALTSPRSARHNSHPSQLLSLLLDDDGQEDEGLAGVGNNAVQVTMGRGNDGSQQGALEDRPARGWLLSGGLSLGLIAGGGEAGAAQPPYVRGAAPAALGAVGCGEAGIEAGGSTSGTNASSQSRVPTCTACSDGSSERACEGALAGHGAGQGAPGRAVGSGGAGGDGRTPLGGSGAAGPAGVGVAAAGGTPCNVAAAGGIARQLSVCDSSGSGSSILITGGLGALSTCRQGARSAPPVPPVPLPMGLTGRCNGTPTVTRAPGQLPPPVSASLVKARAAHQHAVTASGPAPGPAQQPQLPGVLLGRAMPLKGGACFQLRGVQGQPGQGGEGQQTIPQGATGPTVRLLPLTGRVLSTAPSAPLGETCLGSRSPEEEKAEAQKVAPGTVAGSAGSATGVADGGGGCGGAASTSTATGPGAPSVTAWDQQLVGSCLNFLQQLGTLAAAQAAPAPGAEAGADAPVLHAGLAHARSLPAFGTAGASLEQPGKPGTLRRRQSTGPSGPARKRSWSQANAGTPGSEAAAMSAALGALGIGGMMDQVQCQGAWEQAMGTDARAANSGPAGSDGAQTAGEDSGQSSRRRATRTSSGGGQPRGGPNSFGAHGVRGGFGSIMRSVAAEALAISVKSFLTEAMEGFEGMVQGQQEDELQQEGQQAHGQDGFAELFALGGQ